MGYLGRRIGLSQDQGDSNPGGAGGAVGGGILDLFTHGYFERQGDLYNDPGLPPAGLTATGGVISDYTSGSDVYRAHIFTSSGTLNVTTLSRDSSLPDTIEYLVVAGGGASGGSAYAGGGGAGGFRTNLTGHPLAAATAVTVSNSPGSYSVTIGAGGARSVSFGTDQLGSSGNPSAFTSPIAPQTVTSTGGGRGGAYIDQGAGAAGGSGGGGGSNSGSAGAGNTPPFTPAQGNNGGAGNGTGGAGGGGAGGAGLSATGPGGVGGAGSPISINGTDVTYAAGGDGSVATGAGGEDGGSGTGDGGQANGSAGGSGIVVVRYKIASVATAKATGGAISFYGGKTIHTFTSSGTFATTSDWSAASVEYVVIGGGGSGGMKNYLSGAGGAGSYRTGTTPIGAHPVSTSIQVGAGGIVSGLAAIPTPASADGTPSYFGTPITSPGGGGGGTYPGGAGRNGGSGGGGAAHAPAPGQAGGTATGDSFPGTIGTTPPVGWGHDGGDGGGPSGYGTGGGGGAGGAGVDGTPTDGGSGGIGIQLPTTYRDPASTVGAPGPASPPVTGADTSGKYYVAGGGGGSTYPTGTPGGAGGAGGGGAGGIGANGGDGVVNTGSGGGGQERAPGPATQSGRGGSGLVLIAYPS